MEAKTLAQLETKYFGEPGTPTREQYEFELKMELANLQKMNEVEHVPNAETIEATNEARQRKGTKVKSIDDLFDKLNS